MRADLHTHTVCSDGALFPKDIVDWAVKEGVELIAVTDHDAMQACDELCRLAEDSGITGVRGIEVSAYINRIKFHTLGYNVDKEKFKPFQDRLFLSSYERTLDIIDKLSKIGLSLTIDEIDEVRYSKTAPYHAAHIGQTMVKKGYCKTEWEFFRKYLAYGKPAFSCIHRPTPEETCEAIVAAGGFAVVAHPARISMEQDSLAAEIEKLKDHGLGGIEAYYSTHTDEQTTYYKNLAKSLNLSVTGGSDTHAFDGGRGIGKPVFDADGELLEKLGVKKF